jgi:PTH1 family peptidyl-tRNA hydrolase
MRVVFFMKLIVGLGNPGSQYEKTRHNIGFLVVEELAKRARIGLSSVKFEGEFGQGGLQGQKVLLLKPQTYMNLSGSSVARASRFYKVVSDDLMVIHDELDLPLGRIQFKKGGGTGGHHGLDSIVESLGYSDFVRLRVGIGKPEQKEKMVGYVLGEFSREETEQRKEVVIQAATALEAWAWKGLQFAMNGFNRR